MIADIVPAIDWNPFFQTLGAADVTIEPRVPLRSSMKLMVSRRKNCLTMLKK
jgi:hypothetical protein